MPENPPLFDDEAPSVQRAVQTDAPQRDGKGRFLKGNGAAVMTALRAGRAYLPEVFRVLEDKARDFLEQSLIDDGGPSDVSERRKSQHAYRATLHLNILRVNAAIETHGLFDRRGKLRVLWLDKLASLIREARAIDVLLGLDRRQKSLTDLDLPDYVSARIAQASSSHQATAGHAQRSGTTHASAVTSTATDAPTAAQEGQD